MIDWLTLRIAREHLSPHAIETFSERAGVVVKLSADGVVEWRIAARDSVRSDSHQVSVLLGSQWLEISGSPARVMASNNVFGSGDIVACQRAMVCFVSRQCGVVLQDAAWFWKVGRIDVTHNYFLNNVAEVRQSLDCLRHAEGGRLQVRTESESVYWSPKSRMRSAKAYHKGAHLRYQVGKGKVEVSDEQLSIADRLLRLELCLRGEWWRRQSRPWWEWSEKLLDGEHEKFFRQVSGNLEVIEMDNLLGRCEAVARTPGRGRGAFRTWSLVRVQGTETTKALMSRRTWLEHRKILFAAGLSFADLHAGNVVALRRRTIVLDQPVRSWEECRHAA